MFDNNNIKSLFEVAEIEITYKSKIDPNLRPLVNGASKAYDILLASWDMNRIELIEEFYVLLLNRKCECIGIAKTSTGGMSSCIADPKIIFATTLKAGAASIVLAHNHPSQDCSPSQADIELTKRLSEGAKLLDIFVLDHLIISPKGYYSFAEEGLIL